MTERTDIEFRSDGLACRGWHFRPSREGKAPCVILAHGFCGVKEMRLDAYAERFAGAGVHALVFDYRHFGASDGEPRQLLDIPKQLEDWRAAVRHARSLPGVDPERIVLWGTSFSGGHVLVTAVEDGRIAAVISQVPHVDGLASARAAGVVQGLRLGAAALRDAWNGLRNRGPLYVPAVGRPGELAAMTAPGEYEAVQRLIPEGAQINQQVAARVFLSLGLYSPGRRAPELTVPWLVQVATRDATTPPEPAIRAARAAPRGELLTYDVRHFDVYVQPGFERTIADQLAFLGRHLGGPAPS